MAIGAHPATNQPEISARIKQYVLYVRMSSPKNCAELQDSNGQNDNNTCGWVPK